jgi:broad specificity phosphatase PhoE
MAVQIYICRHAEPDPHVGGRFCGALDVGLSRAGIEQAHALAASLAGTGVTHVYASPLRRARETAIAVADACAAPLDEVPSLVEIDFGDLDGLTWREAERRFPDVYLLWASSPARVRFPGGESYAQLRRRVSAAVARILERHDGATVAVVSHAGPIRAIVADVLQLPEDALFRISVDYGRSSLVEWWDGGPIVRWLNASPSGDR